MDKILWQQIKTAFETFDQLTNVQEKQAFLKMLESTDLKVYQALIQIIEDKTIFLNSDQTSLFKKTLDHAVPQGLVHIEKYHLQHVIGVGGGSVVFYAERTDLYDQPVAIKVFGMGVLNEFLNKRFEQESHILSLLQHPYLTRLLDMGVTESGLYYLVMEFVKGVPLIQYANEQKLTIAERLKLFVSVCEGIQYAHNQSIIHRDLKPQHILITEDGLPKILDFGVAKWLSSETENGFTVQQSITIEYASPEQLKGENIHLQTDVYSLGMILYEFLTGLYAYPTVALSIAERLKQLEEVPLMSMKDRFRKWFQENPSDAKRLAQQRAETPTSLINTLSGDLAKIITKALEIAPSRRYDSVHTLQNDIQNVIDQKPIHTIAHPILTTLKWHYYRDRSTIKWIGAVLLVLISTWLFYQKQTQTTFLANDQLVEYVEKVVIGEENLFLEYPLPDPDSVETYKLIRQSIKQWTQQKQQDISVKLRLLDPLIKLSLLRNMPEMADSLMLIYEREKNVIAQNPYFQARLFQHKARRMYLAKAYQEAAILAAKALEVLQKEPTSFPLALADVLYESGVFEGRNEESDKALAHLEEANALYKRYAPQIHLKQALCLSEMGRIWTDIGNYDKAYFFYQKARKMVEKTLPFHHPFKMAVKYDFANVLQYQNKIDSSAFYVKQILPLAQKWYGEKHFVTGYIWASYAFLLRESEKPALAIQEDKKALQILKRYGDKEAVSIAKIYRNTAMSYSNLRDGNSAVAYADSAIQYFRKEYSHDDFQVLKARFTYLDLQRVFIPMQAVVVQEFKLLLNAFNQQKNEGLFAILIRLRLADTIMLQKGDANEVMQLLSEANRLIVQKENPLPDVVGEFKSIQGYYYTQKKQLETGAVLMREGYKLIKDAVGEKDPIAIEAYKRMQRL